VKRLIDRHLQIDWAKNQLKTIRKSLTSLDLFINHRLDWFCAHASVILSIEATTILRAVYEQLKTFQKVRHTI